MTLKPSEACLVAAELCLVAAEAYSFFAETPLAFAKQRWRSRDKSSWLMHTDAVRHSASGLQVHPET